MTQRSLVFFVTALALSLLAAAPLAAAEVTRTLRVELTAAEAGTFAVENLAGQMRIVPGSSSAVVAIATVHAESEELAGQVRFEQVSGKQGVPTLRVRYPLGSHSTFRYPAAGGDRGLLGWLGGGTTTEYDGERVKVSSRSGVLLYADVDVQVPPREVEATFRNVVGSLQAQDVKGTLRFDTGSGDQKIERVSGTIVADAGSGDVTATGIEGSFRCDTGSGDCTLDSFNGEKVSCDTGSGDITIRSSSARVVDADTGSGDIRAQDIDAEQFSADTGSGDVELVARGDRLARIDADTGSGDVVLRLGPDASFEAVASQGSGDIVNRYTDAQPILKGKELIGYRRGDRKIRIDVDTGSGDMVLEPGGASARRSGAGV